MIPWLDIGNAPDCRHGYPCDDCPHCGTYRPDSDLGRGVAYGIAIGLVLWAVLLGLLPWAISAALSQQADDNQPRVERARAFTEGQ